MKNHYYQITFYKFDGESQAQYFLEIKDHQDNGSSFLISKKMGTDESIG